MTPTSVPAVQFVRQTDHNELRTGDDNPHDHLTRRSIAASAIQANASNGPNSSTITNSVPGIYHTQFTRAGNNNLQEPPGLNMTQSTCYEMNNQRLSQNALANAEEKHSLLFERSVANGAASLHTASALTATATMAAKNPVNLHSTNIPPPSSLHAGNMPTQTFLTKNSTGETFSVSIRFPDSLRVPRQGRDEKNNNQQRSQITTSTTVVGGNSGGIASNSGSSTNQHPPYTVKFQPPSYGTGQKTAVALSSVPIHSRLPATTCGSKKTRENKRHSPGQGDEFYIPNSKQVRMLQEHLQHQEKNGVGATTSRVTVSFTSEVHAAKASSAKQAKTESKPTKSNDKAASTLISSTTGGVHVMSTAPQLQNSLQRTAKLKGATVDPTACKPVSNIRKLQSKVKVQSQHSPVSSKYLAEIRSVTSKYLAELQSNLEQATFKHSQPTLSTTKKSKKSAKQSARSTREQPSKSKYDVGGLNCPQKNSGPSCQAHTGSNPKQHSATQSANSKPKQRSTSKHGVPGLQPPQKTPYPSIQADPGVNSQVHAAMHSSNSTLQQNSTSNHGVGGLEPPQKDSYASTQAHPSVSSKSHIAIQNTLQQQSTSNYGVGGFQSSQKTPYPSIQVHPSSKSPKHMSMQCAKSSQSTSNQGVSGLQPPKKTPYPPVQVHPGANPQTRIEMRSVKPTQQQTSASNHVDVSLHPPKQNAFSSSSSVQAHSEAGSQRTKAMQSAKSTPWQPGTSNHGGGGSHAPQKNAYTYAQANPGANSQTHTAMQSAKSTTRQPNTSNHGVGSLHTPQASAYPLAQAHPGANQQRHIAMQSAISTSQHPSLSNHDAGSFHVSEKHPYPSAYSEAIPQKQIAMQQSSTSHHDVSRLQPPQTSPYPLVQAYPGGNPQKHNSTESAESMTRRPSTSSHGAGGSQPPQKNHPVSAEVPAGASPQNHMVVEGANVAPQPPSTSCHVVGGLDPPQKKSCDSAQAHAGVNPPKHKVVQSANVAPQQPSTANHGVGGLHPQKDYYASAKVHPGATQKHTMQSANSTHQQPNTSNQGVGGVHPPQKAPYPSVQPRPDVPNTTKAEKATESAKNNPPSNNATSAYYHYYHYYYRYYGGYMYPQAAQAAAVAAANNAVAALQKQQNPSQPSMQKDPNNKKALARSSKPTAGKTNATNLSQNAAKHAIVAQKRNPRIPSILTSRQPAEPPKKEQAPAASSGHEGKRVMDGSSATNLKSNRKQAHQLPTIARVKPPLESTGEQKPITVPPPHGIAKRVQDRPLTTKGDETTTKANLKQANQQPVIARVKPPPQSARQRKPTTVPPPNVIAKSIPRNASSVVQIRGRHLNMDALCVSRDGRTSENSLPSVYALVRAWVQDDVYRQRPVRDDSIEQALDESAGGQVEDKNPLSAPARRKRVWEASAATANAETIVGGSGDQATNQSGRGYVQNQFRKRQKLGEALLKSRGIKLLTGNSV